MNKQNVMIYFPLSRVEQMFHLIGCFKYLLILSLMPATHFKQVGQEQEKMLSCEKLQKLNGNKQVSSDCIMVWFVTSCSHAWTGRGTPMEYGGKQGSRKL